MSLSLERLQDLLKEDADQRQHRRQNRANGNKDHHNLQAAIRATWQAHGVLAPVKGLWRRPIPDSLYQCPLSAPQTTLVPWKSLPVSVQSCLVPPSDLDMGVVEVPLVVLAKREVDDTVVADSKGSATGTGTGGTSAAGSSLSLLSKRPLGGNLTNKLSEYTRGMSGQSRPFRPGGTDGANADNDNSNNNNSDVHRSIEATSRAVEVLDKGSEVSWRDGTILTAPPGVDFKVGLAWKDVHGQNDEGKGDGYDGDQYSNPNYSPSVDGTGVDVDGDGSGNMPVGRSRPAKASAMFTRSFFDDDSLFGSSSSESSGDDTDKEDNESEEETDTSPAKEGTSTGPSTGGGTRVEPISLDKDKADQESLDDEAEDDADELLAELTFTDGLAVAKRKKVTDIPANPLELAEHQAKLQSNTTRTSWATTNLLPIRDFNTLIPNPAMTYPFTLDDFQQQAVARLERSESVFVAAHTSAGKTVVAEYAVALAKQRATRCVYTSPIKALSNQKFRDFSLKFGAKNVGLITGDMQLNVDDSTVLIMTTEILRSMLYRGADLIRDIEWVIFDEVHYVNDSERGVVWEEVIIMLPSYVNLIFLSATTPNTLEFSDWIGRTKRKPVHVIKTDYRPVPLSHHLWAGLELHKVLEGNGRFLEKGFSDATKALLPQSAKDPNKKKTDAKGRPAPTSRPATGPKGLAWQTQGTKQNWMSLIRYLDRELLTPAVVFSFSKKKCEEIANQLRSLDLNTAKERSSAQAFTIQTIARLSRDDSMLPQVQTICEMVQRGIGVHHGGLLPILKEMVEILFSKNLIKVLFATETFAMGVNMPARAVIFNSIRKHDGTQFRMLEPGEYTQMAGRAGRRGLDKVGIVILCCFGETPPPQPMLRQMLTGSSTLLRSQFRLTYNMILNLLRVEEMSVESMIKRSFSEFAAQRALTANDYPKLLSRGVRTLAKLDEQFKEEAPFRVGAKDVEDYFSVSSELLKSNEEVLSYVRECDADSYGGIVLPGRIILISAAREHGVVRAPAIVLRSQSTSGLGRGGVSSGKAIVCMSLMPESYVRQDGAKMQQRSGTVGYIGSAMKRYYAIQEIQMDQILLVTDTKHKIDATALFKDESSSSSHPALGLQSSLAIPGRDAGNAFAGLKASGRDAGNAFAGLKAFGGKKGKAEKSALGSGAAKEALGSGAAKEDQIINEAVGLLVEAERLELQAGGVSVLDLANFVNRGSDAVYFRQVCDRIGMLIAQLRSCASHLHPNVERFYTDIERKETLRAKVKTLQHLLSNESLQLFPDFLQRKAVLRKLGYVDANETVCVKGRVACEVNTCEELIVTEMVFEGLLNDLEPEEIVAVLSALVYQDKSSDTELDCELPEKLVTCCEQMKTVATNLGQLQKEQGLDIDPGEYCDGSLKFGLVHVVYEWALGVPFKNICELTDVQEGSIVRCITRLDELCREVRNCARVVGNPTLYRKLEAASSAIKRDIVFASSLYVS